MTEKPHKSSPLAATVSIILSPLRFLLGPLTRENVLSWVRIIGIILTIQWLWFQPFEVPSGSMEPTIHGDPRFFYGDRVAVNKHKYGIRVPFMNKLIWRGADPKRWDIVVFNNPEKNAVHPILVKRLVGLPGERIHIAGGKVYVNGKPLTLPASMPHIYYTSGAPDPKELNKIEGRMNLNPYQRRRNETDIVRQWVQQSGLSEFKYGVRLEDKYSLVPKDHYLVLGDNSANSGDGRVFGWVPRENLIGPVFCIWWPFSDARDFTGFTKTWWGRLLIYGLPCFFILYELISASFLRSWCVAHATAGETFKRGDRILVNLLAFGLRLPLLGARLTKGRAPRPNELVFYLADDSDDGVQLCAGRVTGFPGDRVAANGVDTHDSGAAQLIPSGHYHIVPPPRAESNGPHWVAHENLVGSVLAVWWPLGRIRSVGKVMHDS